VATPSPDWNALYATAAAQQGLFTARQATEAGYSAPLLIHHQRAGRFERVARGIYRLVHFPTGEHEDLVAAWLWSEQQGVVSDVTALALHQLSDVLPSRVHLTVPSAWAQRRFKAPVGVVLHHAHVAQHERAWFGSVPVTTVARTLNDCARSHVSPEFLRASAMQAIARGLATNAELPDVAAVLEPYGGLVA
jgi:predicted transcriptional regulator of viral defense system